MFAVKTWLGGFNDEKIIVKFISLGITKIKIICYFYSVVNSSY